MFKNSSKITHNTIPDFGNPNKTEEQKKQDAIFAWIGATDLKDFEPEDRANVDKAIKGTKPTKKQAYYKEVPPDLTSKNERPGYPEGVWRQNHDYTGEDFKEKIKRRLKTLQKSLRDKDSHREADEISRIMKQVEGK